MDDIGKEVVMLESVVGVDSLIVDCEGASPDASLVLSRWVGPELPCEHIKNLLSNPPSFREGRECEVVWINFPETCKEISIIQTAMQILS